MTIYYRVSLEEGIVAEEQPTGHYMKSDQLGVTVFKSLRAAKRKFDQITRDEIARLRALRHKMRPLKTREAVPVAAQDGS